MRIIFSIWIVVVASSKLQCLTDVKHNCSSDTICHFPFPFFPNGMGLSGAVGRISVENNGGVNSVL